MLTLHVLKMLKWGGNCFLLEKVIYICSEKSDYDVPFYFWHGI